MRLTLPTASQPWIAPACVAALGLWQLGEPSLWVDEAFSVDKTQHSYLDLSGELHWLYLTMLKPWTAVAGTSEIALRLPSVAGAALSVALLYGFARRLFGAEVAFVSSLLLAVNPFVVKWSQQARGYTILLALSIASTWLFLRAREREQVGRLVAYACVSAILVLWQFFAGILLLAVHALVARDSRRTLLWLALVAPFAVWRAFESSAYGGPLQWLEGPSWGAILDVAMDVPGGLGLGLILAAFGVLKAGPHRELLVAWAIVPVALSLIVTIFDPVFLDRYLIVSCPAFAMLGGLALTSGLGVFRRPMALAFVALTAVALVLWYAPSGGDNWRGENWRAATAAAMKDADGAIVTPEWALPAFLYYGGRESSKGPVLVFKHQGFESQPHAKFGKRLILRRNNSSELGAIPSK